MLRNRAESLRVARTYPLQLWWIYAVPWSVMNLISIPSPSPIDSIADGQQNLSLLLDLAISVPTAASGTLNLLERFERKFHPELLIEAPFDLDPHPAVRRYDCEPSRLLYGVVIFATDAGGGTLRRPSASSVAITSDVLRIGSSY
jgi:hypothetical protein